MLLLEVQIPGAAAEANILASIISVHFWQLGCVHAFWAMAFVP